MGLNADILKMMQDDVDETVGDLDSVLIYMRKSVFGTASPVNEGDDIDPSGILQTSDVEFVARRDSFKKIPEVREIVQIDGVRYSVESKTVDYAAVTLRLKRGP